METEEELRRKITQLEEQNAQLQKRLIEIEEQNTQLQEQLIKISEQLNRAKNPDPVERPSAKRVHKLCNRVGFDLERFRNGWMVRMGNKKRWFKRLTQIWEILTQENWYLTDVFPERTLLIPTAKSKWEKYCQQRRNPPVTSYPPAGSCSPIPWQIKDRLLALGLWERWLTSQGRLVDDSPIPLSKEEQAVESVLNNLF